MKRNSVRFRISSLKIASLFILLVIFVVCVASAIRLFITARGSSFDGSHQFILLIRSDKQNSLLTFFTPTDHSLAIFPITSAKNEPIGKDLEIGIDGIITTTVPLASKNIPEELKQMIFSSTISPTNVTWYDLARLYFISTTASITIEKNLTLPRDSVISQGTIATMTDPDIEKENQSIQIINASDATGLGSRLSTLITNMGGDVIDIRTAPFSSQYSVINYYGTMSYTAERLQRILGFPLKAQAGQSIADLQILIGTESANTNRF